MTADRVAQIENCLSRLSELVRACELDFTSDDTENGEFRCLDDDAVANGPEDNVEMPVLTFGDIRRGRDAIEHLREILKDYSVRF